MRLRTRENLEVPPHHKGIDHRGGRPFSRNHHDDRSPRFQHLVTQPSQRADFLRIQSIQQIPEQDAVKALGGVVQVFPNLADGAFLVEAFHQTEEHVANIQPLYSPPEKQDIFLAGRSRIQHLSLGAAFNVFSEQLQDIAGVKRRARLRVCRPVTHGYFDAMHLSRPDRCAAKKGYAPPHFPSGDTIPLCS